MTERLAWLVLASWLVLAWIQAQQPDPPAPTPATLASTSPSSSTTSTPDAARETQDVSSSPSSSSTQDTGRKTQDIPPPSSLTRDNPPPSTPDELAQAAHAQANPYLKAKLYLQAEELLTGTGRQQIAETRRAELFGKAMTDAAASPLAAEACIRYLDMVLDRPNPGHPTQLVDRLVALIKKHGIGHAMIPPARVQHIIDRLQPQFPREAQRLQPFVDAAQPSTQPSSAASATETPVHLAALQQALLTQNSLRTEPLIPDPGKSNPLKLTRKNPSTLPVTETLTWTLPPNSAWKVEPAAQTVTYLPGQSVEVTFNLTASAQPSLSFAAAPQVTSSFSVTNPADNQPATLAARTVPLKVDIARYYQKLMIAYATRVSKPPVIDGKLDDAAWASCLPITHFIDYDGAVKLPYATDVRLAWDDTAIYLMARLAEPDLPGLWTKATKRNGDVWTDDSLEVFFDFDPVKRGFVQFIVSANNTPYDAHASRLRWDTIWTSQTGREKDAWTLEIAMPWAALGSEVPKVGEKIGFQLVRNRVRPEGAQTNHSFWQWSPTFVHSNLVPNRFGTLVFTGPANNILPASAAQ